jgi:hypothetical protein
MISRITKAAAVAVFAATAFLATPAAAQEFQVGPFYAGPRIWIGNLNGAVAVGGQIERGFTKPGEAGPGIIAAGLGIDFYNWDYGFPGGRYKYSVVPIQIFGNYHFIVTSNKKIDPYVGLALVYSHISASANGTAIGYSAAASTTDFAGQFGARYFLSDKFAIQGQAGFGYGTLSFGATWRFGNSK